jgi:hypothetical protein
MQLTTHHTTLQCTITHTSPPPILSYHPNRTTNPRNPLSHPSSQVHSEAIDFERRRWGGRLPPLGPSTTTARAALDSTELTDFHSQLAAVGATASGAGGAGSSAKDAAKIKAWAPDPVVSLTESFEEGDDGGVDRWGAVSPGWPAGVPRRCAWRWRGALTDYCVAEPAIPKEGAPAVLLVHGFGAFGDQWRDNLSALAAAGYRVYAPTLPGFGRSEKAAIGYSQDAW